MLQTFRLLINSIIGRVFFAILVLTFGLLGVGYGFRDLVLGMTNSNDAAKVGGQTISLNELSYRYREELDDIQRRAGASFNLSAAQKQEIARDALEQSVDDTLFNEQAGRDGFRVGTTLVRKVIEQQPAFQGPDKKFDSAKFRMALQNQNMSEGTLVAKVRDSLGRQLVLNPIAGSAVAPHFLIEDMYRYRNEQRVAETVTIPNSAATNVPQPTDAQIDTYYKAHAEEFTAPEYRSFTVLDVTPDLFALNIHPSDDDLHTAYDQHKAEYNQPEKRKITQVVLADKAAADAVLQAAEGGKSGLAGGKTLAEAAKAATQGKVQPIEISALAKAEYPEGLRDPVFAAAKDATIGPIQTELGWHVIHIDDVQAGHEVPFDQVKNILIGQVKHDQAIDQLSQQIDKLGDKLTGGTQMEAVAQTIGATPVKFGPLDAKGAPPAGKEAAKDKPSEAQVANAFQLQQGETGQFEDDKHDGYYAVRLDAITPPALRPLADVKAQIVTEWTKEQQAAQIAKRATDLAAKARAGTPMDQVAKEAGVQVATTEPMTRQPTGGDKGPSPALAAALFQLDKVGDVVAVDLPDGQVIAKLKDIRAADPKNAGEKLGTIQTEMDRSLQSDVLAQYRGGLREALGVRINDKAVETVVGQ